MTDIGPEVRTARGMVRGRRADGLAIFRGFPSRSRRSMLCVSPRRSRLGRGRRSTCALTSYPRTQTGAWRAPVFAGGGW